MEEIDFSTFRKLCKEGLSGGFLFTGDEGYLASGALSQARKTVLADDITGFNHIMLDAGSGEPISYNTVVSEMPMMCDKRLVELHSFDVNHAKEEEFEQLITALEMLPDNPQTVFIMVCTKYELEAKAKKPSKKKSSSSSSSSKKSKVERLRDVLTFVRFEKQTGAALNKWIMQHLAKEGITADVSIAPAITAICGNDMSILSGEIAKLCHYVKSQGRTTPKREDLACITRYAQIEAFDFSNAVMSGNFEKCMYIFNDLKAHKEEPIKILPQITSVYVRMGKVSLAMSATSNPAEIAKMTKMAEYPCKLAMQAAHRLGQDKLNVAIDLCAKADYQLKFSGLDGYVIISRLLCQLCNL